VFAQCSLSNWPLSATYETKDKFIGKIERGRSASARAAGQAKREEGTRHGDGRWELGVGTGVFEPYRLVL